REEVLRAARRGDPHRRSQRVSRDPLAAEVAREDLAQPAPRRIAVLAVLLHPLHQGVGEEQLVLVERNADAVLAQDAHEVLGRVAEIRRAGLAQHVAEDGGDEAHAGQAAFLAAATALRAASPRSSAGMMGRPDLRKSAFPCSTLVPSRRTTSGTPKWTCFAAAMIPAAMMSHLMMPPKMLTRTACTCGSERSNLNAAVTFASSAPPPTSRKLAGIPPALLMMSMVAMARPAP